MSWNGLEMLRYLQACKWPQGRKNGRRGFQQFHRALIKRNTPLPLDSPSSLGLPCVIPDGLKWHMWRFAVEILPKAQMMCGGFIHWRKDATWKCLPHRWDSQRSLCSLSFLLWVERWRIWNVLPVAWFILFFKNLTCLLGAAVEMWLGELPQTERPVLKRADGWTQDGGSPLQMDAAFACRCAWEFNPADRRFWLCAPISSSEGRDANRVYLLPCKW